SPEMVRQEQRREAQVFRFARQVLPFLTGRPLAADAEPERSAHHVSITVSRSLVSRIGPDILGRMTNRRRVGPPEAPRAVPHPELMPLAIADIDVPRARIRRDLGPIEDLALSLGSFGLLHPVHVYASHGRYRLIAGERRLRAARTLGWAGIDAMGR